MPCEECTITLQDVVIQLRLLVDGEPVAKQFAELPSDVNVQRDARAYIMQLIGDFCRPTSQIPWQGILYVARENLPRHVLDDQRGLGIKGEACKARRLGVTIMLVLNKPRGVMRVENLQSAKLGIMTSQELVRPSSGGSGEQVSTTCKTLNSDKFLSKVEGARGIKMQGLVQVMRQAMYVKVVLMHTNSTTQSYVMRPRARGMLSARQARG
ncbi:serine/threonine-protein phosphatase 7 long form-like protein [Cucumis melo var. makuwa]|uniref:Serine/threonine-protein phosphatase 7 long form-like protein n=1 Tax=Cucumis melo var. makuwa TaxID=1194695 RepID=A0A5D3DRK0_CUCMM|nr:serine/threonine-protein phosphatase 7 long form-like protein [Cucumis melo var. makuwa]TYK26009.1 serine/threonine-protein phosphatase 7 long form-like protein [Cucumis melo var. makuwa]